MTPKGDYQRIAKDATPSLADAMVTISNEKMDAHRWASTIE
jgi:hypothetical protein